MRKKHQYRAVFLDRDGVINEVFIRNGLSYAPHSVGDFRVIAGVSEALNSLSKASFKLVVVTNQPDVGKGLQTLESLDAMHGQLQRDLPIDLIKVCLHDDQAKCECRKPKPGMFLESAEELGIDLSRSFMVGDRWRDIEAGKAAGCKTLWVRTDYAEKKPTDPDWTVQDLLEAAQIILAEET